MGRLSGAVNWGDKMRRSNAIWWSLGDMVVTWSGEKVEWPSLPLVLIG